MCGIQHIPQRWALPRLSTTLLGRHRPASKAPRSADSHVLGSLCARGRAQPQKMPVRSCSIASRSRAISAAARELVGVPAVIATGGVELPVTCGLVVAQLGDLHARPLGPVRRIPWRAAFEDGDGCAADRMLDPVVVGRALAAVRGDLLCGRLDELARDGHLRPTPARSARSAARAGVGLDGPAVRRGTRDRLAVEALQPCPQHRPVDLAQQPRRRCGRRPRDRSRAGCGRTRGGGSRTSASPFTTAAIPSGSTSGTMCAAWTSARSRSVQIAHRWRYARMTSSLKRC